MIWDGQCGFCAYWITYWQGFTKDQIDYIPFQDLNGLAQDIPLERFAESVRFVDQKGRVYNGPEAAYFSLYYMGKRKFLYRMYKKNGLFMKWSDQLYQLIANNRSIAFRITKYLWGSNPEQMRPFWAIYLFVLVYFIFI